MNFTLSDGTRVHLIGDPHMGKRFEIGVPLHRRGEREAKQAIHFVQELDYDADLIIIVGDLFDHPYVPYAVVDSVAKALIAAAERNPDVEYVVMAGNHDVPRNITAVGAFHDLEARLHERAPSLHVTRTPKIYQKVAIFPWEWQRTAEAQVKDLAGEPVEAAVGHWNLILWVGSQDDHLVPVEALAAEFGPIPLYTGHLHLAGDYKVHGILVHCTGSMEPYAHDQDAEGSLYVTMDRDKVLEADPDYLRDKHVRVRLKPGEDVPEINALAVTPLRVETDISVDMNTLSLEDFDWNTILSRHIKVLDPAVQDFIKERLPYDEQRGSGN